MTYTDRSGPPDSRPDTGREDRPGPTSAAGPGPASRKQALCLLQGQTSKHHAGRLGRETQSLLLTVLRGWSCLISTGWLDAFLFRLR